MNINKMMEENRKEEMKAICKYIYSANLEDLAKIIEEIRCVHDNLMTFNPNTKLLAKIKSVCLNGECIQLNIDD